MSSLTKELTFLTILLISFGHGMALTCEKEGLFGIKTYLNCPQIGQPETYTFCCGDEENRYCCENPFGSISIDQETVDALVEKNKPALAYKPLHSEEYGPKVDHLKPNFKRRGILGFLPKILGILVGVVVMIVLVCVVCCCCCPFCLLYKRRNHGVVRRDVGEVTVTIPASQPLNPPQPMQQYPAQGPFPAQGPYPQPGYPQSYPAAPSSGYPGVGYYQPYAMAAPQPGYAAPPGVIAQPPVATIPPAQPFVSATNDQPPPYTEKQPPFNPNYASS